MIDPQPVPILTDLTPFEQQVVEAARLGAVAEPDDPDTQIRAELIRELLLGRHGALDPRGIQVSGACIAGHLDLDWVQAGAGLSLISCILLDQVTARHARLPYLNLSRSQLPFLHADSLRTDHGLLLHQATVRGGGQAGAIRMVNAHIGGPAIFTNAELANDDGPALSADSFRTDSDLTLDGVKVRGSGQSGAIRMVSAQIGGHADFDDAEVINDTGPAVHADSVRTSGALFVRRATVRGRGEAGAIRMINAHIGGAANFTNAELANDDGPALNADGFRIDGDLTLEGVRVRGGGPVGAIRMINAHIGGPANFTNAELANDDGPALSADGFRTDDELTLDGVKVRGSGQSGAIRMVSAQIDGQANFDDAEVINDTGPAVNADGLRTGDTLFLRGAKMRGSGRDGAIRMIGAHIGGQLTVIRMTVSNPSGPLITLSESRVDNAVFLPRSVICTELDRPDRNPCPLRDRRLNIDRFTFTSLSGVGWRQWLHLIRHHTDTYTPFPYQQLAATERAAGHDNNARHILITQQDDLRRRTPEALGGRVARARHWAWGWLGRYGYRASRLLLALAMTLVLAGAIGWIAGQVDTRPGHHAAERVLPATAGTPCSTVELIGLGIDRGLPLGVTGLRARCDLDTSTRRGEAFTVVIWLIQAAVWALATLAVASYTGLIRKPT